MSSHMQLSISINDEMMNIQSKETQLINVLNKIKAAKQLEQNLYPTQNFQLIDDKTLVSKLKGQIDILTFDHLLKKYKKQNILIIRLIQNGEQSQQKYVPRQQDDSIFIMPVKPQQQQQYSQSQNFSQLQQLEMMTIQNELQICKQNLANSQRKSDEYLQELNDYKRQFQNIRLQVSQLEFEKQRNLDDLKKYEYKNDQQDKYIQELSQKIIQSEGYKVEQLVKSNSSSQYNQQVFDNLKYQYEEMIKGLKKKIDELNLQLDKKEREHLELQQQKKNSNIQQIVVEQKQDSSNNYEIRKLTDDLNVQQQKFNNLDDQYQKLVKENAQLKASIQEFDTKKFQLQNDIKNKEFEIEQKKISLEEQANINKKQENLYQILTTQYNDLVQKSKEAEQKYSQNIANLEDRLIKMKSKQMTEQKLKENLDELLGHIKSNMMPSQKIDNFAQQQYEILRRQNEKQSEIDRQKTEQKQKTLDLQRAQQKELEEQAIKQNQEKKAIKNENMIQNQIKAQKTHGSIDICFVVDCTQSMDPHKENVIKCINQAITLIKKSTNRDCNWASVAYKDVDYLQATKNEQYPQEDFNLDQSFVIRFLKNQKCAGGADLAEDLQLGLRQAANLSWKSVFRVVMVITDAPCHGEKYYDSVSDEYPEKTIEDELDMLIKQKIFFIGINLPAGKGAYQKLYTKKMFDYFKQYFSSKGCLNKIEILDYDGENNDNMFIRFTGLLQQAAESLTQVTNRNTKTKNAKPDIILIDGQKQQINQNSDGAVQALCKKMPDPTQFDKMADIKVKQCKFTVYRSEFKLVAFERCINKIWTLGNNKDDYNIQKEDNQWDCVRTWIHFAEGQMKKVYLMKRFNREQEVYVIKSPISGQPYQSFDEALRECRSHLIAKLFMKRYKETCIDMREEKRIKIEVPQIQYSDFLILEEDGKQFWIAERFFKGEFVKYNNNNGFIDDSKSNINNFSQAFSMFTYHDSDSTMMICDIQGIGPYFTDPAINTKLGGFDETDIGEEGINNYLVNFRGKKIGCEYLDLLDIPYDK